MAFLRSAFTYFGALKTIQGLPILLANHCKHGFRYFYQLIQFYLLTA